MAWYAELQRIKWYCIKSFDAIRFYKKYRYNKWYNSLTKEEKERLKEQQKQKSKRIERELKSSLAQLSFMMNAMYDRAVSNLPDRVANDKYNGLYRLDGFINEEFFKNKG